MIVVESLGVGEMPDAEQYNSHGCNTLGHTSEQINKLKIPNLSQLGLGNLTYSKHAERTFDTLGFFGKLRQQSDGIDPILGHWEICGNKSESLFYTDAKGFFPEIITKLTKKTSYNFIADDSFKTLPIAALTLHEHKENKTPIIYYDDNYALYIVVHPDVMEEEEFITLCEDAREICDYYGVIRLNGVLSPNLSGKSYTKEDIIEYITPPMKHSLLHSLNSSGIPVYTIGNVENYIDNEAISNRIDTQNDEETLTSLNNLLTEGISEDMEYFVYASLKGPIDSLQEEEATLSDYGANLEYLDSQLPNIYRSMNTSDLLIITSSHAKDPTYDKIGNTREYLPILIYSRILNVRNRGNLGVRRTLCDIAETISDIYSLDTHYGGDSFWNYMISRI
ncbi:MAG: hypothetical protein ABUK01_14350 [Leptospirales bacterium]